jgi:hypothetical protein
MNLSILNEYFLHKDGKLYWKKITGNRVSVGDEAGSLQGDGYLKVCLLGKKYAVHRIIYAMHNQLNPEVVDHIDGNRLNNKIDNLRACTKTQNNTNTSIRKHNTSGCKNVSFHKQTGKWRVIVRKDGKPHSFGLYDDIELADLVALEARNKLHGDFASHR